MLAIALKMLTGDRAKYFALIFGVSFATLLMSQQVSIFIGLMTRTANQVLDVREADVWVMDPRVNYVDEIEALPDEALGRVRGVTGVEWAVPFYKGLAILRTREGLLNQISLIGVDDATLVGAPRTWIEGEVEALRDPDAIVFDTQGARFIWPDDDDAAVIGREAEINDHRVVVRGIADASAPFITFPIAYMRYSRATAITPPTRNRMTFVLVRAAEGQPPEELARRIERATGLQAMTRSAFAWRSVQYYLTRTGIPVNFGITIALAVIVGVAITAQTLYLFVVENLRQFGALKAIGVTNRQITSMVLLQGSVVGSLGFAIGIGMSAIFFAVTRSAPALEGFVLRWEVLIGTLVIVAAIIVAASFGSLSRVYRVDPAIVFRG